MKEAFEELINNKDVGKSKKVTDGSLIANNNLSIEKINRLLDISESENGGNCD